MSSSPIEVNTVVLGAGLAGLGVALGLSAHGKSVLVLDKTSDPTGRSDLRYDPSFPASYKSAGMMELYVEGNNILNYFMRETRRIYDEAGVPITSGGGMSIVSTSRVFAALEDVVFDKQTLTRGEEELKQFCETQEPNFRFSEIDGIYREECATVANPEITMQHLLALAKQKENITIEFDAQLNSVVFNGVDYVLKFANNRTVHCDQVVIACGPWSSEVLKQHFDVNLSLHSVLGVMTELVSDSPAPHFKGLVMGMQSTVDWAGRDFFSKWLANKNALNVTQRMGSKEKLTTHLYMSPQPEGSLFVGGPRILLPPHAPQSSHDPKLYSDAMEDTLQYAKSFAILPEKEKGRWSGVMAFTDDELPVIGSVNTDKFPRLFVCTGFASSGFREGVGAGYWLGKSMAVNKGVLLVDEAPEVTPENIRLVHPQGRMNPIQRNWCCSVM